MSENRKILSEESIRHENVNYCNTKTTATHGLGYNLSCPGACPGAYIYVYMIFIYIYITYIIY